MRSICGPCSMKRFTKRLISACRRSGTPTLGLLIVGVVAASGSGCAALGAKPWQHDLLAEHAMQVDPYPLETSIDEHIYFSKEASSGGRSFAGGGCGCN
jgi:hypothetical protein